MLDSHVNVLDLLDLLFASEIVLEELTHAIVHGRLELDKAKHGVLPALLVLSLKDIVGNDFVDLGAKMIRNISNYASRNLELLTSSLWRC